METISSLPIDEGSSDSLATIINELNNDNINSITQATNSVHKMDGIKLIIYALIMACVVLCAMFVKDNVNILTLFLLSSLAFAGILSTVKCD